MKREVLKTSGASANWGGAMGAGTISKHGRNPKSQMSRGNNGCCARHETGILKWIITI